MKPTRAPMPDDSELACLTRNGELRTVLAAFTDMQGRLVGKRYSAGHFLGIAHHGWEACNYLLACDVANEPLPGFEQYSWDKGYGDFLVKPDLSTFRLLSWQPGAGLVLGDVASLDGEPLSVCPRGILRREIGLTRRLGLQVQVATELEFYLFADSYERARQLRYQGLTPANPCIEDYHLANMSPTDAAVTLAFERLAESKLGVHSVKGEWGPGQKEINMDHSDPLSAADRHAVIKHGIRDIAAAHGRCATFMAKYNHLQAGNSCHLHCSLHDLSGQPVGWDPSGDHFASSLLRSWLAGLLRLAPALALFFAPNVNSYRRFQAGSFAPTRARAGADNRTCMFRLVGRSPESVRVENRFPGADVNPYLAIAATLAAGRFGVERRMQPPALFSGNAYLDEEAERMPGSLPDAVTSFRNSREVRDLFGDDVVDHYATAAEGECRAHQREVSDTDLRRYFEQV